MPWAPSRQRWPPVRSSIASRPCGSCRVTASLIVITSTLYRCKLALRRGSNGRGRGQVTPLPPAQIPACAANAPGSCRRSDVIGRPRVALDFFSGQVVRHLICSTSALPGPARCPASPINQRPRIGLGLGMGPNILLAPTPRQEGELGRLVGLRPANFRPGRGI